MTVPRDVRVILLCGLAVPSDCRLRLPTYRALFSSRLVLQRNMGPALRFPPPFLEQSHSALESPPEPRRRRRWWRCAARRSPRREWEAGLACSPKTDPSVMRVLTARSGKEILDKEEATRSGADHSQAARGRGHALSRQGDRRDLPEAGGQRADVSPLATAMPSCGIRRCQVTAGA